MRAAEQLREAGAETLPGIPVFALVDADQAQHADNEQVISWPVAMIENLLLDPEAIWAVLEPHREKLGVDSPAAVGTRLTEIVQGLAQDEARLRVQSLQRPVVTRLEIQRRDDVEAAKEAAATEFATALESIDAAIHLEFEQAEQRVREILDDDHALELFRGKEIFKAFHDAVANRSGLSYNAFAYAVAREAAQRPRLRRLTEVAVRQIERFVPSHLLDVLEGLTQKLFEGAQLEETAALVGRLQAARRAWEDDGDVDEDFEDLRRKALELAVSLPEDFPERAEIPKLCARLGVRSAAPDTSRH